ncbi:MAG: hypothetical protein U1E87_08570 [Alphaproteobacteria bacterium]
MAFLCGLLLAAAAHAANAMAAPTIYGILGRDQIPQTITPAQNELDATASNARVVRQVTFPVPISFPEINLPPTDVAHFSEGWFEYRLEIGTDGSVSRIDLIESFKSFRNTWLEKLIRDYVAASRWTPASENGHPVAWEVSFIQLVMLRQKPETRYMFNGLYSPIKSALDRKEYAKAKQLIEDLLQTDVTRLGEFGLLKMALYAAEQGLGNPHAARRAIGIATNELFTILDYSDLLIAFRNRIEVDRGLRDYGDALKTFERVQAASSGKAGKPTTDLIAAIQADIASGAPIPSSIEIDRFGEQRIVPVRSRFSLAGPQGPSAVFLVCGGMFQQLLVPLSGEWPVANLRPGCELGFNGLPGARFTLNQLN